MVVAETITAISLVRSAVKGIKQVIATTEDIGDISGYINQMFTGHQKLKEADVPPTRAQRWGRALQLKLGKSKDKHSLGAVAQAHIDRKIAEEQMKEMALLINKRFGFGTWDNILLEQQELIEKSKIEDEEEREAAASIQKKILEWFTGIIVLIVAVLGIIFYIQWVKK
tara:strand:+ start:348 stop:854 length:507 start_codon:yes stop_codon:yes gene_type:complete